MSDWSSDVCSSDLHRSDAVGEIFLLAHDFGHLGLEAVCFVDRNERFGRGLDCAVLDRLLGLDIVREHRSGEQRLQVDHVRRLARRIGIDVIAHVVPAEIVIAGADERSGTAARSEEHTSELQSIMSISYAVYCLNKKKKK